MMLMDSLKKLLCCHTTTPSSCSRYTKGVFCHQKQYNFGASTLREKELTKEKMSYCMCLGMLIFYLVV